MAGRCPYLRLVDDRDQVLIEPNPRHRCYARLQPERVGVAYQAHACMTSGYRHCRRLAGGSLEGTGPSGRISRPKIVAPLPPVRRPLTLTEFVVLGLCLFIVLALFLVGYAVFYRLRVGPGMQAAPLVAAGPESTAVNPPPTTTPLPTIVTPPSSPIETTLVAPINSPTPTPQPTVPTPTPYVRIPADSPPTRLVIPRIDLDIPVRSVGIKTIQEGGKPKAVWADVPNAGGFHQTSAYPGNPGNTVINGHRDILGAVFRHLDDVEVGDEIIIYVGDTPYPYHVTENIVVPETFASAKQRAENLKYISYMPEERLTLVTCTPVGLATHRLLVIAKPQGQIVPQMPEAGSDANP